MPDTKHLISDKERLDKLGCTKPNLSCHPRLPTPTFVFIEIVSRWGSGGTQRKFGAIFDEKSVLWIGRGHIVVKPLEWFGELFP